MEDGSILSERTGQGVPAGQPVLDGPRRPKWCRPRRSDHVNSRKPHAAQHPGHSGMIRSPPVRRIVVQLSIWIERGGGPAQANHVHDGLQDEQAARHRGHTLQSEKGVGEMVEDAEEEHDVERADACPETGPSRRCHNPRPVSSARRGRVGTLPCLPRSPSPCHARRNGLPRRLALRRAAPPRTKRTRPMRRCRAPSGPTGRSADAPVRDVPANCPRPG